MILALEIFHGRIKVSFFPTLTIMFFYETQVH